MGTVQPIRLSDAGFIKKVRAIAKDSHLVILTGHAKKRMKQRRINMHQILECLRKGRIHEPAHLTIQGDWKATLEHQLPATRYEWLLSSRDRKTVIWPWLSR